MKMLKSVVVFLLLGACVCSTGWAQAAKVDLNAADQAQFESLPGIGPSLAARILDHRTKNGDFKRVEDLMNVKGIGEKKFLKLKDLVMVGEGSPAKPPKSN